MFSLVFLISYFYILEESRCHFNK